jgi:hypothetical protein
LASLKRQCADPIKIGMVGPLTGPGAESNRFHTQGAKPAVDEINKAGGVLDRPLELVIEDDRTTNPGAILAFRGLGGNADITAFLGPIRSARVHAMTPDVLKLRKPVMIGRTDPALTHWATHGSSGFRQLCPALHSDPRCETSGRPLRRFRFRSPKRDRDAIERRLALSPRPVRSAIAEAEGESKGLRVRIARMSLLAQMQDREKDPACRAELTILERTVLAGEQSLAQPEDHLTVLRKLERRLDRPIDQPRASAFGPHSSGPHGETLLSLSARL